MSGHGCNTVSIISRSIHAVYLSHSDYFTTLNIKAVYYYMTCVNCRTTSAAGVYAELTGIYIITKSYTPMEVFGKAQRGRLALNSGRVGIDDFPFPKNF